MVGGRTNKTTSKISILTWRQIILSITFQAVEQFPSEDDDDAAAARNRV